MLIFELTIGLLFLGAVVAPWAAGIGAPYPALLALAGAALALVPGLPDAPLDPALALALFVAPTVLDAAYDASPRDLRDNLLPVTCLTVIAVGLTVVAVAVAARAVVPSMSWAVALTLGAIVAPPDASAASAVLRQLAPPHRLLVILEGESLFNDASALLVYRAAAGAAMAAGTWSVWSAAPLLLLSCIGGVVAGVALARLYLALTARLHDLPASILTQFLGTFAVWIAAERAGLSAILAVVCYAMTLAHTVPGRLGARHRMASYAVWEVAVFTLNVLAFVLIGLQLRGVLARLGPDWRTGALCAAVVCAAVILVRLAWVMTLNTAMRWSIRRFSVRQRRPMMLPTPASGLLVGWCGMRGIVTLATALALPDGPPGTGFPFRDLLVLCAFSVVICTLVVQGLTLGPLLRRLGLRDDGSVAREIALARKETARAALHVLAGGEAPQSAAMLRQEYEARLALDLAAPRDTPNAADLPRLQRLAVAVQRQRLVELLRTGVIGDDAFHAVEEELDLIELTADPRLRPISG